MLKPCDFYGYMASEIPDFKIVYRDDAAVIYLQIYPYCVNRADLLIGFTLALCSETPCCMSIQVSQLWLLWCFL